MTGVASVHCPPEASDNCQSAILVVDDHEHIRKVIRNLLERESGFEVCGGVVYGYDAIEKARGLNPDLIILDLSMPRMNGIEAARRLKAMLLHTPIVLFTSYHAELKRFDARAAGIEAVAAKDGGMALRNR